MWLPRESDNELQRHSQGLCHKLIARKPESFHCKRIRFELFICRSIEIIYRTNYDCQTTPKFFDRVCLLREAPESVCRFNGLVQMSNVRCTFLSNSLQGSLLGRAEIYDELPEKYLLKIF